MSISSSLTDGLYFPKNRPDRRLIRYFVKYYHFMVGFLASIIIIISLYAINMFAIVLPLAFYSTYVLLRIRSKSIEKWEKIYQTLRFQRLLVLGLVIGVTIFLYYVYTQTSYLKHVKVDTLWLLYLLAISIISQRGSRRFFAIILSVVVICLYLVSPREGKIIISSPFPVSLEYAIKAIWLIILSFLNYILLRYMSDAVADLNLIVDVQNRFRAMEGRLLRSAEKLDEKEILNNTVEIISEDLGFNHVNIFKLDKQHSELRCFAAACDEGKKLVTNHFSVSLTEEPSIIGHVAQDPEKDIYVTNNAKRDKYFLPHKAFPDTKAELVAPILSRDRLYGVLDIQVHSTNYFLQQDIKAIKILTNHIGWVIDNIEQYDHISWINRMVEAIAGPIFTQNDLEQTLQEVADAALIELGADLVILYSYDPGNPDSLLGPIYAGEPRYPELLRQPPFGKDGIVQKLLEKGEKLYTYEDLSALDIDADPVLKPTEEHIKAGRETFIQREGIRANAIIRLLNNGKCVGLLFLNFRHPRDFSFWDKKQYFSFANLAALAIQKMQAQQRLIRVEMADLAGFIHDRFKADTLALFKALNSINLIKKPVNYEKLYERIEFAKDMTGILHNDIQYLSRLLKEEFTDDLIFELDQLSMIFRISSGVEIKHSWTGDPSSIPQNIARELISICREACTNAIKGGKASIIEVSDTIQDHQVQLIIKDNGAGFDITRVRRINGLAYMNERVEHLGGKFSLASHLGEGTTIRISIPFPEDERITNVHKTTEERTGRESSTQNNVSNSGE